MSFISLILAWYNKNKRALPWRDKPNIYHVWLSEIILQQTRVKQGMSYYHTFIEAFPNIHDLAKAQEQEVLNLWQGLGYYSRARNLHRTAKVISEEMGGEFPKTFADLKKLPGIGPYTAAAMASICYDQKVPAIDGNAYRVYARVFGLDKDISDANAHKFFFEFAQEKMPDENCGDFNQAIMELGATVCMPSSPLCMFCPIQKMCVAFQTGTVDKFPVKTKKVKVRKRFLHYFFIRNSENQQFLIKKRTGKDVWQSLYDFPLVETKTEKLTKHPFIEFKPQLISEFKHILTHQRLFIKMYTIMLNDIEFQKLLKNNDFLAISRDEVKHYPFPKPIFSFLDKVI